MKINRLETHDRLESLVKDQSANVFQGAEDCLKKNSLSQFLQQYSPYIYIFAHPRTTDDGLNKRMLWQPRLTRPEPQSNSYLFRAKSKSDEIEVCWMIPDQAVWKQFKEGNVLDNEIVLWSIKLFKEKKEELAKPHPEDLPDSQIEAIYRKILKDQEIKKYAKTLVLPEGFKL